MPYEATMLLIDNSSHALNGDYPPTRILAQTDAVNTLFNAKTQSNPENVVGLISIAGKGPEMLVAPTNDQGKLVSALDVVKTRLYGNADLVTSIQIAQLALKHRPDSTQRQRIIAFVGSPQPSNALDSLISAGKKLKKNNVALDLVMFGSEFDNPQNAKQQEKLEEFVNTVNSSDNSHFVIVPPNQLLSDIIKASAILSEDAPQGIAPSGSGADGGGGEDAFGGVNPEIDPELAMALQLSLQEAQREQAQQNAGAQPATTSTTSTTTSAPASESAAGTAANTTIHPTPDTALQQQEQVHQQQQQQQQQQSSSNTGTNTDKTKEDDDDEMDEDEDDAAALARALQMSKEEKDEEMDGGSNR